jgi:hypothetical protein
MIMVTVVPGGFLGATLVRVAPGFTADEGELAPRLRPEQKDSSLVAPPDAAAPTVLLGFGDSACASSGRHLAV